MSDISQGNFAKIVLKPGDSYRVTTSGVATVESRYGAPAGTTTVTANSVTFGPYNVEASLKVTAVTGSCDVNQNIGVNIERSASGAITDPASLDAVRGAVATAQGFGIGIVIAGDSITEENYVSANGTYSPQARYWPIANALTGQKFRLLNNAGYSGDTVTASGIYPGLLARLESADTGLGTPAVRGALPGVLPFDPHAVVVHIGLNNLYRDQETADAVTPKLRQVFDAVRSGGSRLIACTLIAVNNSTGNYATAIAHHLAVNAWIRNYARTTPGVELCDWFAVTVNPTDTSFIQGAAGDYRDGALHPNNRAGYRMGKELARALNKAFPGTAPTVLPVSNLQTIATAAAAGVLPVNLLPNPLLTGTAAAPNGGNAAITGNVPSSPTFSLSAGSAVTAATFSVVARDDGYGQDIVCDATVNAGGAQAFVQVAWPTQHANAVVGGVYEAECELAIQGASGSGNPTNVAGATLRLQYNPGGVNQFADSLFYNSASDGAFPEAATLVHRTAQVTYTTATGVTNFRPFVIVNFSAAGTARFRIGRVAMDRVS
jgi:lysophospholipase L1-like esterase